MGGKWEVGGRRRLAAGWWGGGRRAGALHHLPLLRPDSSPSHPVPDPSHAVRGTSLTSPLAPALHALAPRRRSSKPLTLTFVPRLRKRYVLQLQCATSVPPPLAPVPPPSLRPPSANKAGPKLAPLLAAHSLRASTVAAEVRVSSCAGARASTPCAPPTPKRAPCICTGAATQARVLPWCSRHAHHACTHVLMRASLPPCPTCTPQLCGGAEGSSVFGGAPVPTLVTAECRVVARAQFPQLQVTDVLCDGYAKQVWVCVCMCVCVRYVREYAHVSCCGLCLTPAHLIQRPCRPSVPVCPCRVLPALHGTCPSRLLAYSRARRLPAPHALRCCGTSWASRRSTRSWPRASAPRSRTCTGWVGAAAWGGCLRVRGLCARAHSLSGLGH